MFKIENVMFQNLSPCIHSPQNHKLICVIPLFNSPLPKDNAQSHSHGLLRSSMFWSLAISLVILHNVPATYFPLQKLQITFSYTHTLSCISLHNLCWGYSLYPEWCSHQSSSHFILLTLHITSSTELSWKYSQPPTEFNNWVY